MDILSHGLYGGVTFGRKSRWDYWTAFLFGIGPDLLAFGPLFFVSFFISGSWPGHVEPPSAGMIPAYVSSVYSVTHSLIIYAVFFALLWWLGKRHFAHLTLAWPLHILVDIPTHSNVFFPTPFLWPLSHFSVNGMQWGQPVIFIPNVILLLCLYFYWFIHRKRRSSHSRE
ncbi:MAG: hypothetical protein Q7S50_01300 [bacterium]|nr:hypothetical protein [bacterium]